MPSIAENLKRARLHSGLTQKDVEEKLSLRALSLKDYETGRLKLSCETAVALSSLYHVSLDELIKGPSPLKDDHSQLSKLQHIEFLFRKDEVDMMLLDPVVRAYLEEYQEKFLDLSIFDLLVINLTPRQKDELSSEILKSIGSLMGIDNKVTETELTFFTKLTVRFGTQQNSQNITKSLSIKYLPKLEFFYHQPSARHFLIWILFFTAKSEGVIGEEELEYINEVADVLKLHRSHFLAIKKYFVRDIH